LAARDRGPAELLRPGRGGKHTTEPRAHSGMKHVEWRAATHQVIVTSQGRRSWWKLCCFTRSAGWTRAGTIMRSDNEHKVRSVESHVGRPVSGVRDRDRRSV